MYWFRHQNSQKCRADECSFLFLGLLLWDMTATILPDMTAAILPDITATFLSDVSATFCGQSLIITGCQIPITWHMTFEGFLFVSVLLSAHAERFSISCMWDFLAQVVTYTQMIWHVLQLSFFGINIFLAFLPWPRALCLDQQNHVLQKNHICS